MKATVHNLNRESMPSDGIYIGRAGMGQDGYFGNPVKLDGKDRQQVVVEFEEIARTRIANDAEYRARVKALHGKKLFCFCAPLACHGHVLANIAEELQEPSETGPAVELQPMAATGRSAVMSDNNDITQLPSRPVKRDDRGVAVDVTNTRHEDCMRCNHKIVRDESGDYVRVDLPTAVGWIWNERRQWLGLRCVRCHGTGREPGVGNGVWDWLDPDIGVGQAPCDEHGVPYPVLPNPYKKPAFVRPSASNTSHIARRMARLHGEEDLLEIQKAPLPEVPEVSEVSEVPEVPSSNLPTVEEIEKMRNDLLNADADDIYAVSERAAALLEMLMKERRSE